MTSSPKTSSSSPAIGAESLWLGHMSNCQNAEVLQDPNAIPTSALGTLHHHTLVLGPSRYDMAVSTN